VNVLALWWACGGGEPTTLTDCASLASMPAREDCRLRMLEPVFASGDAAAFDRALAELEDAASRDLVRLRLAVADPSRADVLCEQAETEGARAKCQQVLGRPHLRAPRTQE
jgi:hypothetical protein